MGKRSGRLDGRVALVTGGASGIGAATCRLFAREGAFVGIADVNRAAADELVAEIRSVGGGATFVELNVADPSAVSDGVDTILDRWGRLDVLVNNAGIGSQTSGDEAGWWRLMRINVLGVAWGLREGVRAMRAGGGGSIINTGSHAALRSARHGVYGSSKAAVHALSRYAALTHAPDRVRVNTVLPGNIYTPIHDRRRHEALVRFMTGDRDAFDSDPMASGEDPRLAREALIEEFRQIHPLGRLASADDIAQAILYLASPDAEVVTGHELLANGGVMAALLSERLDAASWRFAPVADATAPQGVVALVTANPYVAAAVTARFERAGLHVAVNPRPTLADEHAIREWLAGLGRVAAVVFASRPDPGGDLFSQGPSVWHDELAADLRVPWILGRASADVLPPGGSVTFVADAAGATGAAGSPAFCATAAALAYITEDLADLLRPNGIRMNTLVAEGTSCATEQAGLGAPAGKDDIAELALTLMRATSLTGLRLELVTSHPDERPNL